MPYFSGVETLVAFVSSKLRGVALPYCDRDDRDINVYLVFADFGKIQG
ncbi:MAG: hypothetical protein HC903_15500 [Methylacidiphilales bacterium]|nr:hypothetical protein [Candidatus Methylacidiphilales bacterium]NJR17337.1 hypothetical protein [Calothrix sp. CSU_2_0]